MEDGGFRGAGLGFYGQSSGVERAGGLELGGFGVPGLGAGFWGARGRFGGMRVGGFGAQGLGLLGTGFGDAKLEEVWGLGCRV